MQYLYTHTLAHAQTHKSSNGSRAHGGQRSRGYEIIVCIKSVVMRASERGKATNISKYSLQQRQQQQHWKTRAVHRSVSKHLNYTCKCISLRWNPSLPPSLPLVSFFSHSIKCVCFQWCFFPSSSVISCAHTCALAGFDSRRACQSNCTRTHYLKS